MGRLCGTRWRLFRRSPFGRVSLVGHRICVQPSFFGISANLRRPHEAKEGKKNRMLLVRASTREGADVLVMRLGKTGRLGRTAAFVDMSLAELLRLRAWPAGRFVRRCVGFPLGGADCLRFATFSEFDCLLRKFCCLTVSWFCCAETM